MPSKIIGKKASDGLIPETNAEVTQEEVRDFITNIKFINKEMLSQLILIRQQLELITGEKL